MVYPREITIGRHTYIHSSKTKLISIKTHQDAQLPQKHVAKIHIPRTTSDPGAGPRPLTHKRVLFPALPIVSLCLDEECAAVM